MPPHRWASLRGVPSGVPSEGRGAPLSYSEMPDNVLRCWDAADLSLGEGVGEGGGVV